MTLLTKVPTYFDTVWSDYTVKDLNLYETEIEISKVFASENLIKVALNFDRYVGYNKLGYGKSATITRGITEQEAYDIWYESFQTEQRVFLRQLKSFNLTVIPQSVFDGLMLFHWINKTALTVDAPEGSYDSKIPLLAGNWDTLASMIMRSSKRKLDSIRAASILRLADYGKPKDRTWLRTEGILNMRAQNQIGALDSDELRRARFAYYAETGNFLPFTPDLLKRDIAKSYNETLISGRYTYDGTNSEFTLTKAPSMEPVEKLQVKVNGSIIQHLFDYTLNENILTITKRIDVGSVIDTTIKI